MSILTVKLEALASDVAFSEDALRVTLVDGREIMAPMEWFPRLRKATPAQRANWTLIGDGLVIHWPDVDEHIDVESLLGV